MKRVVIVDDSFTLRQYLEYVINSDPVLEVVGVAKDGEEAVELVKLKRPDIVTMDVHMPRMNGYEATQQIMEECPVPIVIVTSSWHPDDVKRAFRAIDAGALVALEKPPGPGHPKSKALVAKLLQTIKTMSEVRVVKRFPRQKKPEGVPAVLPAAGPAVALQRVEVVAIGASTGGPPVIKDILSGLGQGFSVPILIVQHIAAGFLEGMVKWLNRESGLSVTIASDGEHIKNRVVYFAPDGRHMGVARDGRIVLKDGPVENGVRPSVSYLFRSIADAYGGRSVGLILTGMGKDGAMELAQMKERGAVTIAQDRESCVVYGMPAEAVKLNGAAHILSPEGITGFLNSIGE
ncbi:MAG: chemotaxis-specific protein-glutamate methyltransferase CheB [Thermodesulfobacteriota bacterium]|nr:chemotaxis-specific protein-glutamate methyltransferase CheB [Thermodesulfobacteriota bacterium]